MAVTVVIPALNEALRIGAAIDSARAAGAGEVVVADCGSSDETASIAAARGVRLIADRAMRAIMLNRAAREASGDILLFLHADTTLPIGAIALVERAIARGAHFGGFRLRFEERSVRLRVAETMINLRTLLTRCPWGDQAQFIPRQLFLAAGGFREIAIMEDYDLATRMKRRVLLPLAVTTSGRRFLQKGILRTALTNWQIIVRWRLGADANELARLYRR